MVGILVSFWDGLCSGAMLVSGRAIFLPCFSLSELFFFLQFWNNFKWIFHFLVFWIHDAHVSIEKSVDFSNFDFHFLCIYIYIDWDIFSATFGGASFGGAFLQASTAGRCEAIWVRQGKALQMIPSSLGGFCPWVLGVLVKRSTRWAPKNYLAVINGL